MTDQIKKLISIAQKLDKKQLKRVIEFANAVTKLDT